MRIPHANNVEIERLFPSDAPSEWMKESKDLEIVTLDEILRNRRRSKVRLVFLIILTLLTVILVSVPK